MQLLPRPWAAGRIQATGHETGHQRTAPRLAVMDAPLEALCSTLADWATQQPLLRRLWVYGSRVKGTHRPDSDLDIAFEIERLPDTAAVDGFRELTLPRWRSELVRLTGLATHLEPSVGDVTNVTGYLSDSGILIYESQRLD